MVHSEDHIVLAAEYALGTLDAAERAQVESMMAGDAEFAAMVRAWELRLGSLNQMVGAIEPRPIVWENIKAAIEPPADLVAAAQLVPEAAPPAAPEPVSVAPVVEVARPVEPARVVVGDNRVVRDNRVVDLTSRVRRWRNLASAATAIAAALVVMLAMQVYRPELLPDGIRPKPRTEIVEVKTPAPASGQYVALLQKDASSPGFILTIDAATKNFTVRKVGAQPEPGKSYELWIVSDRLPQPRSLGVVGGNEFTARPLLSSFDPDLVNSATYAVSIEPEGGSPTGAVTGPVVFTGKLIETVPPAPR